MVRVTVNDVLVCNLPHAITDVYLPWVKSPTDKVQITFTCHALYVAPVD